MRKLLAILCLLPVVVLGQQSQLRPYFANGVPGSSSVIGTNFNTFNITTITKVTNGYGMYYGTIFTNKIVGAGGADSPAFQPHGGNYYGLTIYNDPFISETNYQVAFGFNNGSSAYPFTNNPVTFHDMQIFGVGTNSDAVDWNISGNPAPIRNPQFYFYNSIFDARHYAFNQIGHGTFQFNNCTFKAKGPGYDGVAAAFLPDQGPTNYLIGCQLIARDGGPVATVALLAQVSSTNILENCVLEATSTNNADPEVTCYWASGEGGYSTIFNGCHFKIGGGATNYVIDMDDISQNQNAAQTIVLNNCYWEGSLGANLVPVNNINSNGHNITVNGGNFKPSDFATPARVRWVTPRGIATNVTSDNWTVSTNFVQGFIYANAYGVPIQIDANIRITTAAVAGTSQMDIQQPAGTLVARVGLQSVAAQTNNCHLVWTVPIGGTYAITNTLTTGAGNSVSVNSGQITILR